MLNKSIYTTAIKYVGTSWLHSKLVYRTMVLPEHCSVNSTVLLDKAKPYLQRKY
jgi:hypothetical protein